MSGDSGWVVDDALGRMLEKIDLFLVEGLGDVLESALGLVVSSVVNGLSMLMMCVGMLGVHRESPLGCGGGFESASAIAVVVAQQQTAPTETSARGRGCQAVIGCLLQVQEQADHSFAFRRSLLAPLLLPKLPRSSLQKLWLRLTAPCTISEPSTFQTPVSGDDFRQL